MSHPKHRRVWRVGDYLGLVSDRPKPSLRQSLKALLWCLPLVVIAALAASVAEDRGAPGWLAAALMVLPICAFGALVSRTDRR